MPLRALPTGAESDAEPVVPYRADAPLPSKRELFASAGWRLFDRLGAGGSSEVWHALDDRGRSVALKIPRSDVPAHDALARLQREHEMLAAAQHGHVVATYGLVEHRGACALALEYLPGGDLVALAGTEPRHWLRAARAVHGALAHLHTRGYVHRDVKARNVLFDARGRAKLIDFASALPLGSAAPTGGTTAAHLRSGSAPVVAAADDAYAYAVLLYELFAGRLPYGPAGRSARRSARRIRLAPPWRGARKGPLAALATRVREVLEADLARGPGLSVFADVLESAVAAELEPAEI
jgi:eukaryotic-like serine/threonine-protein kinase